MKIEMKLDPNNAGQMNAARAFFEILAGVTPLAVEGENVNTTAEEDKPLEGAYSIPVDPSQVEALKSAKEADQSEVERRAKLAKRREKAAAAKKAKEEAAKEEAAKEEAAKEEAAKEEAAKEEAAKEEAAKEEAAKEEAQPYTLEDVRALITKKVAEGHKDAMFAKIRTMPRRDETKKFSVPNLAPESYGDFMDFMKGLK